MRAHLSADLSIWETKNTWSWQYEQAFANWLTIVAEDKDFFLNAGLAIDCADTVYGFRWIFSRMHYLPAMTQSTDGWITNESLRPEWLDLDTAENWFEDQRFLAALNYVMRKSFTQTLAYDSYPVEISSAALIPGTFFLNLDGSKHVDMIYKTNYEDPNQVPFEFVSSTVPRAIKPSKHLRFWYDSKPKTKEEGFRRFLWPRKNALGWYFEAPENMPFYSNDQFSTFTWFTPFWKKVYEQVKPTYSREALAELSLSELVKYFEERVSVADEAYAICFDVYVCGVKSKLFDEWSTPSRDKRIWNHLKATQRALGKSWKLIFKNTQVIEVEGQQLSLWQLYNIWRFKKYSSDPRKNIKERWGLSRKSN
jgi:hypothetical protein